jgi:hypothetical protein
MFVFSVYRLISGGAIIFQPCIRWPGSQPTRFSNLRRRTKHLLWDELNVLKRKSNVKGKQGIDDYRLKSSMLG